MVSPEGCLARYLQCGKRFIPNYPSSNDELPPDTKSTTISSTLRHPLSCTPCSQPIDTQHSDLTPSPILYAPLVLLLTCLLICRCLINANYHVLPSLRHCAPPSSPPTGPSTGSPTSPPTGPSTGPPTSPPTGPSIGPPTSPPTGSPSELPTLSPTSTPTNPSHTHQWNTVVIKTPTTHHLGHSNIPISHTVEQHLNILQTTMDILRYASYKSDSSPQTSPRKPYKICAVPKGHRRSIHSWYDTDHGRSATHWCHLANIKISMPVQVTTPWKDLHQLGILFPNFFTVGSAVINLVST